MFMKLLSYVFLLLIIMATVVILNGNPHTVTGFIMMSIAAAVIVISLVAMYIVWRE